MSADFKAEVFVPIFRLFCYVAFGSGEIVPAKYRDGRIRGVSTFHGIRQRLLVDSFFLCNRGGAGRLMVTIS